jgi:hypothetical protein
MSPDSYTNPILSDNQQKCIDYIIGGGDYELKPTQYYYSVYIDGECDQDMSVALRSLLKRGIVEVECGKVVWTDDVGWRDKKLQECIQMDDIVIKQGVTYRIYKHTDYSCYGMAKNGGKDIFSTSVAKNTGVVVYSRHDHNGMNGKGGRYQKSAFRGYEVR